MIIKTDRRFRFLLLSILVFFSCAGSETQTQISQTKFNDAYKQKPVSKILVIAVTGNEHNRRTYENKFVARLKSVGVEAVASEKALAMPPDLKLKKEKILSVVSQYGNDAVIITQLVDKETRDITTRGRHGFGYSLGPRYTTQSSNLRLETNLYDAKTAGLIWSGQSDTLSNESTDKMLNDVIRSMVSNWLQNGIIAPK